MAKKPMDTAAFVKTLTEPILADLGLSLWDIVFEKEGALRYLRVYIEREGADITIDDCENVSRPLDKRLDETDPIDEQYVLEVSSPGLGRRLRSETHFLRFIGEDVRVRFIRETNGVKEFSGTLEEYNKDEIKVGGVAVKLKETAYVKLCDDENLF
ncbi:MAG: ribosome maturation factor RimP [Ruminococcus sp.]|jgi:ribosome maturation factor RimP|nr:ribosome maturation factor RimP [Ruminococcus sp.]